MAVIAFRPLTKPLALFLLVTLGVGLGLTLALTAPEPKSRQTIEWLENPRSLGTFSLDSDVGVFSNQSLTGRWTIVVFGFLRCPDICPTSLSQMSKLVDGLTETTVGQDVAFVFVSVDPARDSINEIGQYVRHFHASIRGVTGEPEPLSQFAGDLGIQYKVSAERDDYSVAHSITFSIIDPAGVFRGRFRPGFDLSDLINNLTSEMKGTGVQAMLLQGESGTGEER